MIGLEDRLVSSLLAAVALLCLQSANGFLFQNNDSRRIALQLFAAHRWNHTPFDFSSKSGWDNFYEQGITGRQTSEIGHDDSVDDVVDTIESLEYEWHPHIPHSAIVEYIKPTISKAYQYYSCQSTTTSQDHKVRRMPSILLIGCGNSALPRLLHDAFDNIDVEVTCLDYSPVCIEMIKSMYKDSCPHMKFAVGDATRLQDVQWEEDTHSIEEEDEGGKHFDAIVDKGLLDALMCGEGFEFDYLMNGIHNVLTDKDWGMHVLICFELSKASKTSLVELGNKHDPGLQWDFNMPVVGSENGRACFNIAWRSKEKKDDTNLMGIKQKIITEWN